MIGSCLLHVAILVALLTFTAVYLGQYMANVFNGAYAWRFESFLYRLFGIDKQREMGWKTYTFSLLAFSALGFIVLFFIQLLQHKLPFNPLHLGPVRWDTAFNTALSFVTNTNWQAYASETTMSYGTQMWGLTVQNFLSAAIGIATCIAFIRSFIRKSTAMLGNFWVDITRTIVYVLLPLSCILSLALVWEGTVQNLNPPLLVRSLEGSEQIISQGPAASQTAIKELGTNGGGFFAANSCHPYENPTPITDFLQIFAMLLIPAALPFTFGAMQKNKKQGWMLYAAMLILFLINITIALWAELHGSPLLAQLGIAGGANMEGKEVRLGIISSVIGAHATTATSCGAVNSMLSSMLPLTGFILLFNMMVGEVIFGGVGSGFIGLLLYAIFTMFIAGLMIGRTPEIFGKKLEPYEMIMASMALLLPSIVRLIMGAIAISTNVGISALHNTGPHGLSEIIYAFTSAAGNNGSAFAGLQANTLFYNITIAITMLVGRLAIIIPPIALAGSLVRKKLIPEQSRFPTASPLFLVLLVSTIFIVGALTFFPVLVLAPILEHVMMTAGNVF